MSSRRDVVCGIGTCPVHDDGGWALPGGGVTRDREVAYEVALRLDLAYRRAVVQRARKPRRHPVVVTRRPGNPSYALYSPI